ncbi:MAG: response regulator [Candidatus Omnitrophica bacterium]|nr:response regulator [Candidatus Omnitrophota bacterium]
MPPLKLLIVDDAEDILFLIKRELRDAPYEVFTATNGQEAIDKAGRVMPDLMLLDIMMPDMDGGEVVRVLKGEDRTRGIPIIFLTGMMAKTEDGDSEAGVKINDTYYPAIAKPFERFEILNTLNKYFEHQIQN